jgi:trigger factor
MSESTPAATETPAVEAKVEDAGPCRKKIQVTVPAERVREEVDRAYLELIQGVHVPGFRQGHLPRKVAEMRFGKALRQEVKGSILEKAFGEALEKHGLTPLGQPDLHGGDGEIDPAKPFTFEVTVEVRPEIKVPDLKGISVRRVPVKVEQKDVDAAIQNVLLDRAELRPAEDGTVGERDMVVMDAAVLVAGERIIDAENVEYRHPSEVVAGVAVPGVSKVILGKKQDEEFTVKATLPGNFKLTDHAGKEADLKFTIRDVKRFHLPALDAEFAKSMDFDSVDELKAEARRAVEREKGVEAEKALDDAILDAIIEKAPIELPEGLVKREIGQVLSRYQADLHMQGAPNEVIEEKLAEVQGSAKEHVGREFRVAFLVEELAKQKGIFVTEGEVDEQVVLMAGRYGRSAEEMRKYLEQRDIIPSLRGRLRERKVLEAVRKDVKIQG